MERDKKDKREDNVSSVREWKNSRRIEMIENAQHAECYIVNRDRTADDKQWQYSGDSKCFLHKLDDQNELVLVCVKAKILHIGQVHALKTKL